MRGLGYHDTRNLSHPRVVFNCMYDDKSDLPNLMDLYALLTFKNSSSICVPLQYWAYTGNFERFRTQLNEIWYNYILRTENIVNESPIYGQISTNADCTVVSNIIPIKDNRTEKIYNYGVCLHQSLYNLSEPEMLVHWVELNLALGAEFMTIYLQNEYIPETYYTLMIPYIKRGVVEVLDWGLRPPVIPGYTISWGQSSVNTECLYRNMYRVKYLGLYDIDEFIVPQKLKTIPQMINKFERNYFKASFASAYTVENVYFYDRGQQIPELNKLAVKEQCPGLKLPRYYTYTLRSYKELPWYFMKLIVKPKAVVSLWIHSVKKQMPGYTKHYPIPIEDALLHHYRLPEKSRPNRLNAHVTFTISRYYQDTIEGIMRYTCNQTTKMLLS